MRWNITDQSGQTLTVEADRSPTQAEAEEIFASQTKTATTSIQDVADAKPVVIPPGPPEDEAQRLNTMREQGTPIPAMEPTATGEVGATIGEGYEAVAKASPADLMADPETFFGGFAKEVARQVNPENALILTGIGGLLGKAKSIGGITYDLTKSAVKGFFAGQGAKIIGEEAGDFQGKIDAGQPITGAEKGKAFASTLLSGTMMFPAVPGSGRIASMVKNSILDKLAPKTSEALAKTEINAEPKAAEPVPPAVTEPITGASLTRPEGALPEKPTADALLTATPSEVSTWKSIVRYGPNTSKAIAEGLKAEDIPKMEAQRDQLRKEANDKLSTLTPDDSAGMMDAQKLSLKAQTLNEVIDDFNQAKPQPSPGTEVSKTGAEALAQPEVLGMGAAKVGETKPTLESPTSIKNSIVDKERSERGLESAVTKARRSFGTVWDEAMSVIDREPTRQDRLIAELKQKPRAITDTEDALLFQRQIDLQNESAKAARDLTQAHDDGRLQDVDLIRERENFLSDQLLDIYNTGESSGTETARGLSARRMMANEDFSLAAMGVRSRVAKGGRRLTDSEVAEIADLHKRITETQKAFDEYRANTEKELIETPADISKDMNAMRLKARAVKAKYDFNTALELDKLKRRTLIQKAYGNIKEALNLPRTVKSSFDLSAVFRQGGWITFGNPTRGARAIVPMLKAFASEEYALALEQSILSRPNAALYSRSKLYLAPLDTIKLSAQEEAIMSRLAHNIPGVRNSNRAYVSFLNKLRSDSFDEMVESLSRPDKPLTSVELNAISNYINVATGRGDLGKAASAAEVLATVFFSPRLTVSRFQIIAGQPFYGGSARTRLAIAREYGKTLAGIGVVFAIGAVAGADIETDSRSSDFGKLKFGNTRVDPMMGLAQTSVLLSRLASGETKTGGGKINPIRGDVPYGGSTGADIIARFTRAKLNPALGIGVNIASGSNVVGEPTTPTSVAADIVVPLAWQDILTVMEEQGVPAGTAIELLSILGMGVQNYEVRKSKK